MATPFFFRPLQLNILNSVLAKKRSPVKISQASEQGLTLLECLVAIVVIGITVVMVTPPLFIAAATRVQNQDAEKALQIAQGQIDRIRVLVSRSNQYPSNLPSVVTSLQSTAAPTAKFGKLKSANTSCSNPYNDEQIPSGQALPVDVDGDCQADFLVQIFRTAGTTTASETAKAALGNTQARPSDFSVGVRVYSILASGIPSSNSFSGLSTDQASLQLTSGTGRRRTSPLAVIYTPFAWSDQSDTLCGYQKAASQNALPGSCPAS